MNKNRGRNYENNKFDGICHVPIKPKKEERFRECMDIICKASGLTDLSSNFKCSGFYPDQKEFNFEEREINVNGKKFF